MENLCLSVKKNEIFSSEVKKTIKEREETKKKMEEANRSVGSTSENHEEKPEAGDNEKTEEPEDKDIDHQEEKEDKVDTEPKSICTRCRRGIREGR